MRSRGYLPSARTRTSANGASDESTRPRSTWWADRFVHGRCLANCLFRGFASIPADGAVVIEFLGEFRERSEDRWAGGQAGRQAGKWAGG